ncbi:protein kinase [Podospora didyma]|uniref:Protein kinase n=1 Tax=Podospora didyma TaxID=330526 RepID=A0AAE0N3U0_9PEZI|nr:protein kinase [Podospora didyma]
MAPFEPELDIDSPVNAKLASSSTSSHDFIAAQARIQQLADVASPKSPHAQLQVRSPDPIRAPRVPTFLVTHVSSLAEESQESEHVTFGEDQQAALSEYTKSDQSSIVLDHGDSSRLAQSSAADEPPLENFEIGSAADSLLSIGDWVSQLQPSVTQPVYPTKNLLQKKLRKAMVRHHNGSRFLPIQKLEEIVTAETVKEELTSYFPLLPPESVEVFTEYICKRHLVQPPPPSRGRLRSRADPKSPTYKEPKYTTCQRIFAILILIDRFGDILEFIRQRLLDIDLPFIVEEDGEEDGDCRLVKKDGSRLACFDSWSPNFLDQFDHYQWIMLAPFFARADDFQEKVFHYPLEPRLILPWVEHDLAATPGGFSRVTRVKIHASHHNFDCPENGEPSFAIKQLHSPNKQDFDNEVETLKKFSHRTDTHLVKLLATYEQNGSYYLIFPWAKGNLRGFWEQHPHPSHLHGQTSLVLWVAKQCHDIAAGLSHIHKHVTTSEYEIGRKLPLPQGDTARDIKPANTRPSDDKRRRQRYGRHGDVKPENILWFDDTSSDTSDPLGVLKISDFGLTKWHSASSKTAPVPNRMQATATYRAPEIDLPSRSQLSQKFDIWALGCLYLEFLTWYLMGWDAVYDTFCDRRIDDDDDEELRSDKFFNIEGEGVNQRAKVKSAVTNWIAELHSHSRCTPFVHEFLDMVENELLQVDLKNRMDCSQVVGRLSDMYRRMSTSTEHRRYEYCMKGQPRRPKQALECTKSDNVEDDENNKTSSGSRVVPFLRCLVSVALQPWIREFLAVVVVVAVQCLLTGVTMPLIEIGGWTVDI